MIIILLLLALIDVQFVCAEEFNTLDAQEWNSFKVQFNKQYASSAVEQQKMKVYKENLDKIAKHNELFKKGEVTFEMGMNHFGDLTAEEFQAKHLSSFKTANQLTEASDDQDDSLIITSLPPGSGPVPEMKSWVKEGAVTEVKNQAGCGDCWAFSVVGAIESHHFIHGKPKKLISLSEQNLLDCVGTKDGIPHNCEDGGTVTLPFQYVIDNKGIDTEQSYPYKAEQCECHYKAENKGATVRSFKIAQSKNEKLLMEIVGAIGPVVAIYHAEKEFTQFYKSGIYSSKTCGKTIDYMNHGVVIVGYGRDEKFKLDYWIVKNSWGKEWGDGGYFRLKRNNNECGIALENVYPIV